MVEKVLKLIKENHLIEEGDRLVLGVSGGPDSLAMLSILNQMREEQKIKFDFVVAHVNHEIRGQEADRDENFVKEFCKKIKKDFYAKRIDVLKIAHNKKIGTEEAGREVRYEFFDEVMEKTNANKIAIAHNKNDKIETILMNLLRGSGISGLKGMEPIKNKKYIRPLLTCERYEIEKYCKENCLNPCIDLTNFENTYTRNKIRNVVIPYIQKEFNPSIIDTLDRLSELVKEEDHYFQKKIKEVYQELLIEEKQEEIILDLKAFNLQEKVIKSRVLLYTIARLLGDCNGISKIHIEDLMKLCMNNIGNKYLTPNKKIKVFVKNQKIFFIKQM